MREEGHETFTIGPEKGKMYNSKHGLPCKADYGFDDIKHKVTYSYGMKAVTKNKS